MPDHTPTRATALTTTARLSLGNAGPAVSTRDHLAFHLDHALARDAVHTSLDFNLLYAGLRERGLEPVRLHSAAADRRSYLRRPDLGRQLSAESMTALSAESPAGKVLFLLADGLSALALERHALPLLEALPPSLSSLLSPLIPVITNARVAIGDEIGALLHAQLTVLLIGERPGLSSPDSLGVYITWDPHPGRTDAERNCISNIRQHPSGQAAGLSYTEAAHRIAHYIEQAFKLQTTGIALKDPASGAPRLAAEQKPLP